MTTQEIILLTGLILSLIANIILLIKSHITKKKIGYLHHLIDQLIKGNLDEFLQHIDVKVFKYEEKNNSDED